MNQNWFPKSAQEKKHPRKEQIWQWRQLFIIIIIIIIII